MGHFVIVPGLMSLLTIVIAGLVACRVTRPVDFAAGVGGGLVIGLAAFSTALPTAAFAYIVFRALRTLGGTESHDVLWVVYDLVNGFAAAFVAALGARRVARGGDFAVGVVVGLGVDLVLGFGLAFGQSFFSALENPLTAPCRFVFAAGLGAVLGAVGAKGVSSRKVVAGVLISVAAMMLPRHERQIRRPERGLASSTRWCAGADTEAHRLGLAFIAASMCVREAATTRLSWTSRR
jgi:hypothetical protein